MNKRILHLAVPNIISNLSVPLLGLADLALMGHMGSLQDMGAIALGGMIFNFIYWLFGFLRMGTTGFTAQAKGRRDLADVVMNLQKSLFVALLGALVILSLQSPISWLSFQILNGSEEVETLTKTYFNIRIWAAPATIGLYAFTGWFIGMQNTRIPMIITIALNLLNIGFNFLFIFAFDMRADGVALGTVLAQYCGLLLAIFFFFRYYRKLLKYATLKGMLKLKLFFTVNGNLFIRTLLLLLALSFFTVASAGQGDTILAVNTLLLQFFTIFAYFLDGFAFSAEALTGLFLGAGDRLRLKKMIQTIFIWGSVLSLVFTLLYLGGHNILLGILTDKPDVIEASKPYLYWIIAIPLITFPAFLWDGIYIGAMASKQMRNVMIIATLVCFFPVYLLTHNWLGNHALWLSFTLMMLTRSLMMTIFAPKALNSIK